MLTAAHNGKDMWIYTHVFTIVWAFTFSAYPFKNLSASFLDNRLTFDIVPFLLRVTFTSTVPFLS